MKLPKTRRELVPLLEERGLTPRKGWGQCFLLDPNMLEALARDAGIGKDDLVLEIGPGPGTLTEYLLEQAGLVISVEIDKGMAALLTETLGDAPNFRLLCADVMGRHNELNPVVEQAVRDALETKLPSASLRCAANLPYSISSPVLIALLESGLPFRSLTLLVQLEVGQKLCAKPGSEEWGILSIIRAMHADAEIVRKVPRQVFWPQPKVDSAVVRVTPRTEKTAPQEYAAIKRLIHGLFQYRRKSILQGARHAFGLSSEQARSWLEASGISPSDHVEKLSMESLRKLALSLPQAETATT